SYQQLHRPGRAYTRSRTVRRAKLSIKSDYPIAAPFFYTVSKRIKKSEATSKLLLMPPRTRSTSYTRGFAEKPPNRRQYDLSDPEEWAAAHGSPECGRPRQDYARVPGLPTYAYARDHTSAIAHREAHGHVLPVSSRARDPRPSPS